MSPTINRNSALWHWVNKTHCQIGEVVTTPAGLAGGHGGPAPVGGLQMRLSSFSTVNALADVVNADSLQERRRTMQALEQNRTERARLVDALQHLAKGGGGGYSEAVGASGCCCPNGFPLFTIRTTCHAAAGSRRAPAAEVITLLSLLS